MLDEHRKTDRPFDGGLCEALVFLGLSLGLLLYSLRGQASGLRYAWKLSPYLFPLLIAAFLLILSILLLARALRARRAGAEEQKKPLLRALPLAAAIALAAVYVFAMRFLPFAALTPCFLALLLLLFGERRVWAILAVSLLTTGLIVLIFGLGLHVALP